MYINQYKISVLALIFLEFILTKVQCSFIDEWAAEITGGEARARQIAEKHNFDYLGKIFENGDVYNLRHRRVVKRSANPSHHHTRKLEEEPEVLWSEQQVAKKRVKRDMLPLFEIQHPHNRRDAKFMTKLSDPKWSEMWYLNRGGSLDMNVQKAWANGITGKGVVVTILDDGLEKNHPDLIKNFDPKASMDVNGRDPDPMPRYDVIDSNRHGTRCAGEVAADANNSICAVGVAYEASIGGIRMLDGDVTDAVEARSLSFRPAHIDIYSASWGPDDDGKTVDGPGQLATRAFVDGIMNGRGGKGSIFVWASGNGGRNEDNCNCDGYTNAIWTLSISSVTENGRVPWYSEACSSSLASTYSSGENGEAQIITTDLHKSCTTSHSGTSASAPLAAGICALALQANRDLTWRDMQHIVVRTARPENLAAHDWQQNGVGRKVSHKFGYGLMDAYGMVELARNWTTVSAQKKCDVPYVQKEKLIPQKSFVTLTLEVSDCPGVNYLEHVQAKVTLTTVRRGEIEIFLISPAGTRSKLLALRPRDFSRTGFHSWPFMTVHMWGESPHGIWKLEVHNNGQIYSTSNTAVQDWTLLFYGTTTEPGMEAKALHPLNGNSIESNNGEAVSPHATEGGKGSREGSKPLSSIREKEGNQNQATLGQEDDFGNENDLVGGSSSSSSSRSTASPSVMPSPVPLLDIAGGRMPHGCTTVDALGMCIECVDGMILHGDQCIRGCPPGQSSKEGASGFPVICNKCHYSCMSCSGPYDYQCLACWPDADLYNPSESESFCHSHAMLQSFKEHKAWLKFTLPIFATLFVLVFILSIITYCNYTKRNNSGRLFSNRSENIARATYARLKADIPDDFDIKVPFHDDLSGSEEDL